MRIIVITPPQPDAVDFEAIDTMMKAGLSRLHLRFPAASEDQMRSVIERINRDSRKLSHKYLTI